jgi:hypothetical protein
MRTQETGTPRGCRSVCRIGRAGGETDSATQMFVPPPSASVPSGCRAAFDARPTADESGVRADRHGWPPRHTHDRRGRSPDGTVVALAHLGAAESRRPAATLPSSHAGWHQSDGRPAARPVRRRSRDVCSLVWRDLLDSDRSSTRHTPPAPSSYRAPPASSQSGRDARANRVTRSGLDPTCRRLASRAAVASTSSPNRSPVRVATSATGYRCEDKENAGETRSIRNAWSSTLRSWWWNRKEGFDEIPERVRKQRGGHSRPGYRAEEDQPHS